jgi:outer membrane protein OmpA-like peptidoglycan-associated protein
MTNDFRRHWQVALATLLIWCAAGLLGPIVQAADDNPATVSIDDDQASATGVGSQALRERLDALVEQATARVGEQERQAGAPGAETLALREQLQAAETQIALLKNVVIQSLRAQSAAEEALRREQATQRTVPQPALARTTVGSPELMLADQLEALTDTVQRLRAEVDGLRAQGASGQDATQHAGSVVQPSNSVGFTREAMAATVENEDAMLADAGMGGQYEPLIQEEPFGSDGSDASATAALSSGAAIKVADVHFNSGSARLTPGGERKTREAVERIRSMGAAKVRVVAFADTVGDAASNLVLSKERARSVAAMLQSVGVRRELVEVVGSGEQGIPEPTGDGVPEPLNRCAGIFVIRNSTG